MDIKVAVEKKKAHSVLSRVNVEGSMLTRYPSDDTDFWRALRRELIMEGLPSAAIHKHKHLIKAYVIERGTRGVLDDGSPEGDDDQHDSDADSSMPEKTHELPNTFSVNLDASQQAGDEPHDQDVDLRTIEGDPDHLIDVKTRERTEVKIKSRPPRPEAKTTISEGSRDRSGIKPDPPSGREQPKQPR